MRFSPESGQRRSFSRRVRSGVLPPRHRGPSRAEEVTLFDALQAFFREHHYCGELDGGVEGDRVWMTCTCGAAINRNADRD
jgi:hypothetical protein